MGTTHIVTVSFGNHMWAPPEAKGRYCTGGSLLRSPKTAPCTCPAILPTPPLAFLVLCVLFLPGEKTGLIGPETPYPCWQGPNLFGCSSFLLFCQAHGQLLRQVQDGEVVDFGVCGGGACGVCSRWSQPHRVFSLGLRNSNQTGSTNMEATRALVPVEETCTYLCNGIIGAQTARYPHTHTWVDVLILCGIPGSGAVHR